jgi:hypothetical protein
LHRISNRTPTGPANRVEISDVAGETYLRRINCEYRDYLADQLRALGLAVRVGFQSEREDWIQMMAAAGFGVCSCRNSRRPSPACAPNRSPVPSRHCRVHAKFARLVTRGSHHTARSRAANSERNPAQRRIVALLYRRVESVHIDVDDAAETQRQVGRLRHAAGLDITRQPA